MERALRALKSAFRRIFSVNPDWRTSIATTEYRPFAPGYGRQARLSPQIDDHIRMTEKQQVYRPPEVEKLDPVKFHYYTRDSRRSQPSVHVLLNPTAPVLPACQEPLALGIEGQDSTTAVTLSAMTEGLRPPTRKYRYEMVKEQPPADGYFTIVNVK